MIQENYTLNPREKTVVKATPLDPLYFCGRSKIFLGLKQKPYNILVKEAKTRFSCSKKENGSNGAMKNPIRITDDDINTVNEMLKNKLCN